MNIKKILGRKYILASRSERRKKLLNQLGLSFVVVDSNADEINSNKISPVKLVKINSENKSRKVAGKYKSEIIIGSDTIVVLGKMVLGKPRNEKEAVRFLSRLSNKKHIVYTGINLIDTKTSKEIFSYEKTEVHFRKLKTDEIKHYVENHKPLDKAGAYGIQDDFGCLFINKIAGDYYNVVGLPLTNLFLSLQKLLSK
ncbi:MAG: septum formation protein Maf [Ignavibacteriae bacterium]|nr:septum formation protein Maf [Ignavibacteriota bacterium]